MQKLKEAFFSEKGMGIVNTLFCISAIFRKGWLTVAACLAWAVYLFFAGSTLRPKGASWFTPRFLRLRSCSFV